MITSISGREELLKLKASYEEVISFDGKAVSETDFIQATQSQSMFASKKLVVLENKKGFPASLSKFLNNMTVSNFRNALKDNDVQFVFIMMCRQTKKNKDKLLELDYKNKQGLLPCDFPTAIELFLLGI